MGKIDFITKWGKRLVVAGAVTGGIVYCGLVTYRKMELSREGHSRPMSDQENEEMSRREVYIFIQQNSFATVTKLLVQLKETVNQHLNTEAITSQIRNNPTNKMVLWESLKSSSFSRAVVCGCVSSMVGMMVRVQLSVIAGYRCCQGDGLTNERQTAYLSIMYRSFEKNLPDLVSIISTAADSILSTYSLKHQVTLEFILELFNHIMEQANHTQRSGEDFWLLRFMMPQTNNTTGNTHSEDVSDLIAATEDALEIQDMQEILKQLVDRTLTQFSHSLTDSFHSAAQSSPSLPMARVIPIISDHSLLLLDTQHHKTLLQSIVNHFDLMNCCRNIFEAFSK